MATREDFQKPSLFHLFVATALVKGKQLFIGNSRTSRVKETGRVTFYPCTYEGNLDYDKARRDAYPCWNYLPTEGQMYYETAIPKLRFTGFEPVLNEPSLLRSLAGDMYLLVIDENIMLASEFERFGRFIMAEVETSVVIYSCFDRLPRIIQYPNEVKISLPEWDFFLYGPVSQYPCTEKHINRLALRDYLYKDKQDVSLVKHPNLLSNRRGVRIEGKKETIIDQNFEYAFRSRLWPSLVYLSKHSRPDIALVISLLMQSPKWMYRVHYDMMMVVGGYLSRPEVQTMTIKREDDWSLSARCAVEYKRVYSELCPPAMCMFLGKIPLFWQAGAVSPDLVANRIDQLRALKTVLEKIVSVRRLLVELNLICQDQCGKLTCDIRIDWEFRDAVDTEGPEYSERPLLLDEIWSLLQESKFEMEYTDHNPLPVLTRPWFNSGFNKHAEWITDLLGR